MSKDRFTEQWTQKTFTNADGDKMRINSDLDDSEAISIYINGEEFWFYKKNAVNIAEALKQIADS